MKEGIKLAVILQGASLALASWIIGNTFGVAGAVAGMSVAVALVEAQGDQNWDKFRDRMERL